MCGSKLTVADMPDDSSNDGDVFEMWELIWAKAKTKDDWWPCQICEVSYIAFALRSVIASELMILTRSTGPGLKV